MLRQWDGNRQWATATLREHLVRGYTLDRRRLEHNARELESALKLVRKANREWRGARRSAR